jgi:16S rRNA processing protein RimM
VTASADRAPDSWIEVGRIGRPQGIKGQVTVELRTDIPEVRFAPGAQLLRVGGPPVSVEASTWHQGRLILAIAGVADRNQAEALRDVVLHIDGATDDYVDDDPDSFSDSSLKGLSVELPDGTVLGSVTDVLHPPGQDVLEVTRTAGSTVLLPFVRAVVPTVDIAAGRIVATPPEGLLDL